MRACGTPRTSCATFAIISEMACSDGGGAASEDDAVDMDDATGVDDAAGVDDVAGAAMEAAADAASATGVTAWLA